MVNKIALEFARYVLEQNPKAKSFVAMYDAMTRAANLRSFRNLGREELAGIGISFSLLATDRLERVIEEARNSLAGRNDEGITEVEHVTTYGRQRPEVLPFVPPQEIEKKAPQRNGVLSSPLTIHIRETVPQ